MFCFLAERETTTISEIAPTFPRLMTNQKVEEGENVCFEVSIKSHPQATVTWKKDGELFENSPRREMEWKDASSYYFMIHEARVNDKGKYEVTATNAAGSCSCSAMLNVLPYIYSQKPKYVLLNI